MDFEVASIHLGDPGKFVPPSVGLNIDDERIPPGTHFKADFTLPVYISFAYKLVLTQEQTDAMLAHLPAWVRSQPFVIDAEAPIPNPAKDQMRLMVQSLLADRFQLVVHFEAHDMPAMALVLIKSGKLGPRLRPHSQGPPCDAKIPPVDRSSPKIPDVWIPVCGTTESLDWTNNTVVLGSRNTTMDIFADYVTLIEPLGRPVVDQTGLTGRFDIEANFTPPWKMAKVQSGDAQIDLTGPTFLEALKDQLGLKLKPTHAVVQSLVIDHVEQPSSN